MSDEPINWADGPASGNGVWDKTTDWSLVADAAQRRTGDEGERAWGVILERYRQPVTLAVRRRLRGQGNAEEAVDSFFSYLFTGHVLDRADPERGRFRCFLQVVLRRFLSRELAAATDRRTRPLEWEVGVVDAPAVEREEEAEWAQAVLRHAIARLLDENNRGGEILLRFHGIAPYPEMSSEALCAEHDLKPNALYQAMHRARRRLRELVLDEIKNTCLTDVDYQAEKELVVARLLEAYSHVFTDPAG